MGKINVLSFEIANLIAAGEVVERPSSVLKELIENSIDAGATQIVAEIKRGGVSLIRVTDNGCGIEKEDLPVALKRHATSKISDRDDLYKIMTLGFRGEALAAISSVSEVTIITKTRGAEVGYMLTSEGGSVTDISEVGTADGTTVVVENLFYNVPARRKFLKKDATEAMNVAALVEKVALSRPDISIQLLIDGQERFKTFGDGDLLHTIRAIYGKEFASKMIRIEGEADGIRVFGFIGRSDNVRKNRNLENIFVNGRYVKSITAQTALEKAFTSYIAPECFPTCALFIEMNPYIVDVNVHPAKLEVKFSDERRVFEAVYYTVKVGLEKEEYRPEMVLGAKKSEFNPLGAFVPVGDTTKGEQLRFATPQRGAEPSRPLPEREAPKPSIEREFGYKPVADRESGFKPSTDREPSFKSSPRTDFSGRIGGSGISGDRAIGLRSSVGEGFAEPDRLSPKRSLEILEQAKSAEPCGAAVELSENVPEYKFVGEAFDCYVIIEMGAELLMIDKHAAHERVIFEDLKKTRAEDKRMASQPLLLPITVILSPEDISCAKEYREELEAVGFELTVLDRSVDLTAIPDAISAKDAEALFVNMLAELVEGRGNPAITDAIRREKALYQIACKAAIKGGRVYDRSVLEWLIGKVLRLPDITVCPHGRPIAYKLTKNELDRQFNRLK